MTRRRYNQYKWIRKLTLMLVAAPLFQALQCVNGLEQVGAGVGNGIGLSDSWPVTIIRVSQTLFQILLSSFSTTTLT
ncbi:MAG: hypothetical protein ACE5EQ_05925 [Phycisphaerae bacterium]